MPSTEGVEDPESGSLLGRNIPNYKVIRKIGSGGMGEVYLAEDLRLKRQVAIKQLFGNASLDVKSDNIRWEARAAAQLNHPGIATVYDLLQVGVHWYIVMEFVQGETLSDRIRRGRLSVDESVRITLLVAEAIAHAHGQGIIHRDLKPANIRLTPEGVVKVLDFGLAQSQINSRDERITGSTTTVVNNANRLAGTPAYMSPEQLGQKSIDSRTDIYSLGVVFFEMLVGHRPFTGGNFLELAASILKEPPPEIKTLRPDVPDAISQIVVRALSKSRDERFASMSALCDALRAFRTEGTPTEADKGRVPAKSNPVLAIFPLLNLSGDAANDFIGIGMCEVLIANASALDGITVLSRASVSAFRGADRDLKRIAQDLGATFIFDGSYQRIDNRIRLTAMLLEAENNRLMWRDQMDGTLDTIFEMQTKLGRRLASAFALNQLPVSHAGAFPTESVTAFSKYAQARILLERKDVPGNISRAIELLDQSLNEDPEFAMAHAAKGEAYWEQYHQMAEPQWTFKALSSLAEALRFGPNQTEVRRTLARIYGGTGRNEEALVQLQLALDAEPGNDEIHRNLGNVLFDLGRRDEALDHFEQAIRLRPNFWENHGALGGAWHRMGEYKRAIVFYSRVVELQPDNTWGFQSLGTAYHALGEIDDALYNYERSMAISPNASSATNIGTIWYGRKNYTEALKFYELAIKLKPNKPASYRNRGDAYLQLGDKEKARESYDRAVQLMEDQIRVNPKNAEALSRLAVYEAKLGRFDKARLHVAEAAKCDPLRVDILYRTGVVEALAGDLQQSAAQIKTAVDRGYSFSIVLEDDDLRELRSSEPFISLFGPVSAPPARSATASS